MLATGGRKTHLSSVSSWQVNVKACLAEALLDLKWIQWDIKTTRRIAIPPLETIQIQGLTKERCHMKKVHVMMEAPAQHYCEQVITISICTELKPGSSKLTICMRNVSAGPVTIPARTTIGSVSAAYIIPPMLALKLKLLRKTKEEGNMQTKQN